MNKYLHESINLHAQAFSSDLASPIQRSMSTAASVVVKIDIMYVWEILKSIYNPIPMGRHEFETSSNMNMVGLVLCLIRSPWSTGKAVIMYKCFCAIWGIL